MAAQNSVSLISASVSGGFKGSFGGPAAITNGAFAKDAAVDAAKKQGATDDIANAISKHLQSSNTPTAVRTLTVTDGNADIKIDLDGVAGDDTDAVLLVDTNNSLVTLGIKDVGLIFITGDANVKLSGVDGSVVLGGEGAQMVDGGAGDDFIFGGSGYDTAVYHQGGVRDVLFQLKDGDLLVQSKDGSTGTDTLRGIENLRFDGADTSDRGALTRTYEVALGRTPGSGELDYWEDCLANGFTMDQIFAFIADSDEAKANAFQGSDSDFVNELYHRAFGRGAEAEGLAYWENALATGATREQLTRSFAMIAERDGRDFALNETPVGDVLGLYQGLLGRAADEGGANYWLEKAAGGASKTDMVRAMLESSESFGGGGMSDEDFVALLYKNALGREASQSEIDYWVSGDQDRADVAVNVIGSMEAQHGIIGSVTIVHNII